MPSKTEKIFAMIMDEILLEMGDNWFKEQEIFKEKARMKCEEYGVSVLDFFDWISKILFGFIAEYVYGVKRFEV